MQHGYLMNCVFNLFQYPVTLYQAALWPDDKGLCNGEIDNLLQQGFFLQIFYLFVGLLYFRTVMRAMPEQYYKYWFPGISVIMFASMIIVLDSLYRMTIQLFFNLDRIVGLIVTCIPTAIGYYLARCAFDVNHLHVSYDFYVISSHSDTDLLGYVQGTYWSRSVLSTYQLGLETL